ncbi:MAG: putative quinol monooxygenase [Acidimicrobiia bacterium]|nr:putative quinol monooxygenase [Acidimicrobiia bacterium]
MYGLIGQITVVAGGRDELATILAAIGDMPGCLSYVVAKDSDDPDSLWVTELWESKQAHADSLELPHVQTAIGRARPLIVGFETRVQTEPIGGIGIG